MTSFVKRHLIVCFVSEKQKNTIIKEFQEMIVLDDKFEIWLSLQKVTSKFWKWLSEENLQFGHYYDRHPKATEVVAAFNIYKNLEKEVEAAKNHPEVQQKKGKYVVPTPEEIEFVNNYFNIDILELRKIKNGTYIQVRCPYFHLHKGNDVHPSASLHLMSLNIKCFAHTSKFKYYKRSDWIALVKSQKQ